MTVIFHGSPRAYQTDGPDSTRPLTTRLSKALDLSFAIGVVLIVGRWGISAFLG
jgi:hypothetical protein